jgi:hypothetical protein
MTFAVGASRWARGLQGARVAASSSSRFFSKISGSTFRIGPCNPILPTAELERPQIKRQREAADGDKADGPGGVEIEPAPRYEF